MTKMDIMKLPNKETSYFSKNIIPWIANIDRIDESTRVRRITFKKDTPIDVINKFLICRPKLTIKYSSHYLIEQ